MMHNLCVQCPYTVSSVCCLLCVWFWSTVYNGLCTYVQCRYTINNHYFTVCCVCLLFWLCEFTAYSVYSEQCAAWVVRSIKFSLRKSCRGAQEPWSVYNVYSILHCKYTLNTLIYVANSNDLYINTAIQCVLQTLDWIVPLTFTHIVPLTLTHIQTIFRCVSISSSDDCD